MLAAAALAPAQGFHQRAPILYKQTADHTAVTALGERLAKGETTLPAVGRSGRLVALLRELGVPVQSQTLVFSRTSLQRHRISPHNPRAVYFGPDVYVGWVPGAASLELAAGDPVLGVVFYTLDQGPEGPGKITRDDSCLSCHGGSRTGDEPGLIVRSVFPDEEGDPLPSAPDTDVTLATPLAERWGGWLVTGQVGGAHRGNGVAVRGEDGTWSVPPRAAVDLGAFAGEFAAADYPAATSDVGALLVLEQQVDVHDRLIRAALQMRCLLHGDEMANRLLGETGLRPATAQIADRLAGELTAALLLAGAAPLAGRGLAPGPGVAQALAAQWPADDAGRRLGVPDLRERLFTLPMSPMVQAPAFAALPEALRGRVLDRLRAALQRGELPDGVALDKAERRVLHHHLAATVEGY